MTDDQIIALADIHGIDPVGYDRCIAFARAIIDSERESCAMACDECAEESDEDFDSREAYNRCAEIIRARSN